MQKILRCDLSKCQLWSLSVSVGTGNSLVSLTLSSYCIFRHTKPVPKENFPLVDTNLQYKMAETL